MSDAMLAIGTRKGPSPTGLSHGTRDVHRSRGDDRHGGDGETRPTAVRHLRGVCAAVL
jgi:hypothetical protein